MKTLTKGEKAAARKFVAKGKKNGLWKNVWAKRASSVRKSDKKGS